MYSYVAIGSVILMYNNVDLGPNSALLMCKYVRMGPEKCFINVLFMYC